MGPLSAAVAGSIALAAWGVRGRSSSLLAPSVWRGPTDRKAIALTFDDGPSEGTAEILDLLASYGAKASFFMCGRNARRHRGLARRVASEGHAIGNHTERHVPLWRLTPRQVVEEVRAGQLSISDATGVAPRWFRAPYGVRWFGLKQAQASLGLTGVMWTAIARDWKLPPEEIVARMKSAVSPGGIWCFHDGRELQSHPDVSATVSAVDKLLSNLSAEGWDLVTLPDLLGIQ